MAACGFEADLVFSFATRSLVGDDFFGGVLIIE
jgi:hypothetical protein